MQIGSLPFRFRVALACAALALASPGFVRGAEKPSPKDDSPARWETAIRAFEAADRTQPPPSNAIEFLGSSSIRLWTNAPAQFPGHRIFNRGFGGSHLSDAVAFVDRIVIPYRPKLIVLYAGDNDLAAGKSPERVFADFQAFVQRVRRALPETRIAFIAIKPCPAREKNLEAVRTANRLIQEFTAGDPKLAFLDVFTPSLTAEGRPRAELYRRDGLHPNAAGYKLWAGIVKPFLDTFDPPPRQESSAD
jgi:lysophospholipase L1-like esterase